MTHRLLLPVILLSILVGSSGAAESMPNVVLFLVDDMGWMDSSAYGSTYYETPHMERLAKQAMRFTDAYALPLCSPTRASILTGQYSSRHGVTSASGHRPAATTGAPHYPRQAPPNRRLIYAQSKTYLDPRCVTLAEMLRDAGYRTGHFGKWHLGLMPEHWPDKHGFQTTWHCAPDPGPPSYFSPYGVVSEGRPSGRQKVGNITDGPRGEYITDRLTDEALKFLASKRDEPFFLSLWHYGVHGPWGHKEKHTAEFAKKKDPRGKQRNPIMASMLKSIDQSLGRVLDKLDELGLAGNTLFIFYSDNGGNTHSNTPDSRQMRNIKPGHPRYAFVQDWKKWAGAEPPTNNAPLREGKGRIYEGGIRVPLMVRWPGKIEPRSTSDAVVGAIDLYPTILDALGLKRPPGHVVDGVSFLPVLDQTSKLDRDTYFTWFPHLIPAVAVRQGDWKLIRRFEPHGSYPDVRELYNLRADLGETRNLAATMPDKVKRLDALIDAFIKDTGALEPKPNPAYKRRSATSRKAPKALAAGLVQRMCKIKLVRGALRVEGNGRSPFLGTAQVRHAGPMTLKLRLRSTKGGSGKVQWNTTDRKAFPEDQTVEFTLRAGADWQDVTINLPVKGRTSIVRLYLPANESPVEIQSIAYFSDASDRPVRTWNFAATDGTKRPAGRTAVADYPLRPVPFNEVKVTSDFWRPRLLTQQKTLVPFAFERTQPGVEHLKAARDALAGKAVKGHRPHRFIDSDLYKVMEGAAYLLQLQRDPELEATLDGLSDLIASAQHENGYLYPSHTTGVGSSRHMMGDRPYEFVVHSHELYNVGHMYEAAIAYYRATGKDKLLKVAEKSAQHLHQVFFVGDPEYNDGKTIRQAPGHQELELALVKLFRVTGKRRYLDMAREFLEIRGVTYVPDGKGVMAPTYAQQHAPVLEQKKAVGHAVRATYLYSAMADVGTLTGDPRYAQALGRIWSNITDTRMHITGGLGAVHGIEGFGPEYELPNAHAFNETCAAVGNVLFNYRMFLLHKDAKYLDVAEVALLNNVLAAVSLEGNRFFYVNPLDADGKHPFNHGTAGRAPWFGTACCPSNMARLLPQVPGMTYAHDDELYVTFYADSETRVELKGVEVGVRQTTAYPNDGKISVVVQPTKPTRFRILLRIPTWARDQFVPGDLYRYADGGSESFTVSVNGAPVAAAVRRGFVAVDRQWTSGDKIDLTLPMPVRVTTCHAAVEANRNRVAFTRGPLVLCAEGVDNGGATQRFFVDDTADVSRAASWTRTIATGSFQQVRIPARAVTKDGGAKSAHLVLTPYYAWNNRGVSSMTVWFPRRHELAVFDPNALPKKSVFAKITASHTFVDDTVVAVGDNKEPKYSTGRKVARWTSRPQKGEKQWVEARFHETKALRKVGVYWMQDREDVKFPAAWSLEVEQGGKWKPIELHVTDKYGTRANQYNVVRPAAPLKCDAIRIRMTPQENACVGILEIRPEFD